MKYFLTIDAGTTVIKTVIFNSNFKQLKVCNLKTLPVGLAGIVGQYQIDWGFLLSGAVLASLPVIILFIFIGKYFVSGLTEGAIK